MNDSHSIGNIVAIFCLFAFVGFSLLFFLPAWLFHDNPTHDPISDPTPASDPTIEIDPEHIDGRVTPSDIVSDRVKSERRV